MPQLQAKIEISWTANVSDSMPDGIILGAAVAHLAKREQSQLY